MVNYHINEKGADETKQEIEKLGAECLVVKADVSKSEEISKLFDEVVKRYKTVDILINNAAIPNDKVPFLETPDELIYELVNTDLIGPMLCSKKAIEIMRANGGGKILNTSSIRGWEHGGRSVVYASSKGGLNSFSRTLAKIVAPLNIQVNAVAQDLLRRETTII